MSKKLSNSPARHSFQKEKYLERRAKEGRDPDNDPDVQAMLDYFDSFATLQAEKESDPKWCENNMEYDLRTTDWILLKVRSSQSYAQNLYAALCNNSFIKLDVMQILTETEWSCSWRYAGGIIADMREEGDYIDWYCSGIRDIPTEVSNVDDVYSHYTGEGCITDEIRNDLKRLGWVPAKGGDWEMF